ncbi:MAG: adenylate/guanylate cyclase domain-containing protein [Alphaproteobacteria bacterium]|jgi:adenylate cyclase|nr:adenylate/guanylate cyclase domain-containing protein [Alphaproteobacteria bacterium]
MTAGMRWFETYVPKTLVLRLMQRAGDDVTVSTERTLTVMFTDIRGFSTMAETMDAPAIAALLNHHFELLSACIEAEGGTVDKFIGDSVMAFWGAPDYVADHADRGVRAAQAMQRAVGMDNAKRRAAGQPPIAVRVGLHSGPVVVGNIGSISRVNYTVVGDTVNAASRLESLAKEISLASQAGNPDDECVVLFSEATKNGLEGEVPSHALGSHKLRGRSEEVQVYQLLQDADASDRR